AGIQANDVRSPTLFGTAEPFSTLEVYKDGRAVATVFAGSDGTWSYTARVNSGNDSQLFQVTATDFAGNTSAPSNTFNLPLEATPLSAPPAASNWVVSGQTTADGKTFEGTGTPGQVVAVMDGHTILATVVVDGQGHWALATPTEDDGKHSQEAG